MFSEVPPLFHKGVLSMYVGRDMTELSMLSKSKWDKQELSFFHHSLQQMVPYLNQEGQSIHREIIEEIEKRGGLSRLEADYTHGTEISYD
jgi:hypothetical protein